MAAKLAELATQEEETRAEPAQPVDVVLEGRGELHAPFEDDVLMSGLHIEPRRDNRESIVGNISDGPRQQCPTKLPCPMRVHPLPPKPRFASASAAQPAL